MSKQIGGQLLYVRVSLAKLVADYHARYMKGQLFEWSYDARKDEVLIEVMVDDETTP